MTTKYESSDGVIFDSEAEAKKHQAVISKETAEFNAQRRKDKERLYESYNYVIDNFNEGNWVNVVNTGEALLNDDHTGQWYRRFLDSSEKEKILSMVNKARKELKKLGVYAKKYTDERGYLCEGEEIVNGKLNGMGKTTDKDGDVYEGYFVDGIIQNGKYYTTDGFCYEGDFKKMKLYGGVQFHGKGKVKYKDGSTYEGDFKDGSPHGKGVMTYPDGKVENGNFRNGEYKKGLFG